MDADKRHRPEYDTYDCDTDDLHRFYVEGLALVLGGDRVFLADGTNAIEIRDEIEHLMPGNADLVIHSLGRSEASRFAYYVDWDAVCCALPDDHPILGMPIPYMSAVELDLTDPRLAAFDFEALRAEYQARTDQALASLRDGPYGCHTGSSVEDLPPLA